MHSFSSDMGSSRALVRRFALSIALFTGAMLAAGFSPLGKTAHAQGLTIVEFFTSQGCNSCPPADRVAIQLGERSDVLTLGYHVDYWDYLGWKDTFSDPAFTERQRAYAAEFHSRSIYTPQAVVAGTYAGVGSRGGEIRQHIQRMQREQGDVAVPISLSANGREAMIQIGAMPMKERYSIRAVWYSGLEQVAIRRGENRGKTIDYVNIVRGMDELGRYVGMPVNLSLDLKRMRESGADHLAIMLQMGEAGPIIGAARVALPEDGEPAY